MTQKNIPIQYVDTEPVVVTFRLDFEDIPVFTTSPRKSNNTK